MSINRYLRFLKREIDRADIKLCVDSANGAAYKISKKIFKRLTTKVMIFGDDPDGKNINDNVGATNIEYIKSMMKINSFDYGIALDGDGDRIKIIDKNDYIYNGDIIALIIAKYLKAKGMLKYNTIVLTEYSNQGIIKNLKDNSIEVLISSVGDSNIANLIQKNDLSLGAEGSGHVIINDVLKFGDGILTAIIFFKILKECNYSLERFLIGLNIYPEKLININNYNEKILEDTRLLKRIEELNNDDVRVILRKSGTENLLRLYVSAIDKDIMNKTIKELEDYINGSA